MKVPEINLALSGAIALGFCVCGLFFRQFFRATKDRLFGYFAVAFFAMGLERVILLAFSGDDQYTPYVYFFRLGAFGLLVFGIVDKNRH